MLKRLKTSWQELKQGRPGKRFQERADRAGRGRSKRSRVRRVLEPTVGVILFFGGAVLCLLPGPGLPLLIIGAALVSERSRTTALVLDWSELKVRKILGWGKTWWRGASRTSRAAAVLIAVGSLAGVGYAAYSIGFGL